jgi:lipoprotein-anchoring transpeptidase ErfK/SrfK
MMKGRRARVLVAPVALVAVVGVLVVSGALPLGPRAARETPAAGESADASTASPTQDGAVAALAVEPVTADGSRTRAARADETGTDAGAAGAVTATAEAAAEVRAAAEPVERRILVSIRQRRLLLVEGSDTLLRAPVAIGMGKDFSWGERDYHFATPRGERRVIGKAKNPIWIVPEWHYYEKATNMGLTEVVKLEKDARIQLADSSFLVVRGDTVGRINHFGHFAPFTPGTEIIFDGKVYVPPLSSLQRRVPEALGPYKLDMGDGYLIHGTHPYNEDSIGEAVSHGCVRMRNADLIRLYPMVTRGTKVIIS